MKLNWIERLYVNSPIRLAAQYLEVHWFSSMLPIDPGASILEIGCGRGAGARLILEKFKPDHLNLMDLDFQMIKNASAYLKTSDQKKIHFCTGDATDLPFGNKLFDAVFGFGFLHHVLEWRSSLSEVVRVLKKGGVYYMVEFYPGLYQNFITKRLLVHPECNRFNSLELRDAFEDVNLTLTHTFEMKKLGILGIGIKK